MKLTKDLLCSGIYYLKNIENNKLYIGSSKNIRSRIYNHKNKFKNQKHSNPYLQNAVNKHGFEVFECGILEKCDEKDLLSKEQYYLDTLKPEYNLTLMVIRNELSKESRLKQANTRRKRIKSGEIVLAGKEIYVYNIDGSFYKEYSHIIEACRELGIKCNGCISRALYNSSTRYSHNYLWSLTKEEFLTAYNKRIYK